MAATLSSCVPQLHGSPPSPASAPELDMLASETPDTLSEELVKHSDLQKKIIFVDTDIKFIHLLQDDVKSIFIKY